MLPLNPLDHVTASMPTLGCDIEQVERFLVYASTPQHRFIQRIYTPHEQKYCFSALRKTHIAQRLAARFCAKEAVYKALSAFGETGLSWHSAEVRHGTHGEPWLQLHPVALAQRYQVQLSLSHTTTMAMAQVLVFRCV